MARPDGSFYLHPSELSDAFAMAVALPDAHNGEPLDHSLRAFIFRNGFVARGRTPSQKIFSQNFPIVRPKFATYRTKKKFFFLI